MLMLFRVSTGGNWAVIFHECHSHSWTAAPYFTSFLLLASWVRPRRKPGTRPRSPCVLHQCLGI